MADWSSAIVEPKGHSAKQSRQSPFRHIRQRKKRRFLDALVLAGGNVTRAAELAGVDRSTVYTSQWSGDPVFAEALEQARELAADALQGEAVRRAFEGILEPVGWYKGQPGGYVRRYSDTLLIFLLKGAFPHRYSDKQEVKGQFAHIDFTKLPDEALSRIAGGEHPTSVLASMAARYEPEARALPVASKAVSEADQSE